MVLIRKFFIQEVAMVKNGIKTSGGWWSDGEFLNIESLFTKLKLLYSRKF